MSKEIENLKKENILIYKDTLGNVNVDVYFEGEDVWVSQNNMATLFDTTKQNISLHLQNAFEEQEIDEKATVKEYLTVQKEGNREVKRAIKYYSLDAVLSVGYRVKSKRATDFRKWATTHLKGKSHI